MLDTSVDLLRWGATAHPSVRLCCFPCAGGGPFEFRSWTNHLPSCVEVLAIRLPGRETRIREAPFSRLEPLVEAVGDTIRDELDCDLALFGHSMGAVVAFELARWLRSQGLRTPVRLFVAARIAPHMQSRDSVLHELPEDQFIQRIQAYNGSPRSALRSSSLMALLLPTLRADFAVVESYRCQSDPPLACPITAFAGLGDRHTPLASVERWADQTRGDFTLHMLPGDHFFIRTASVSLTALIAESLDVPADASRPIAPHMRSDGMD